MTRVPAGEVPAFTGVAPPRPPLAACTCRHGEEWHVLDHLGRRRACGQTIPGWKARTRCPCAALNPTGGAR